MTKDTAITPFRIDIPQAAIDDLHDRLACTRWPVEPPVVGWERGAPVAFVRALAERWRSSFDWRAAETRLNDMPQFTTTIDGQTIHFAHVRSPEPDALPLVLTHGYPSSFAEFVHAVGPLTDPRTHGGDPADAFHVVIPSLPGFGFSSPLSGPSWEMGRTARAWTELMRRLGYDRYVAHGGDIGGGVAGDLGKHAPDAVLAAHASADIKSLALIGGMLPSDADGFTAAEIARLDELRAYEAEGRGYLQLQSTRPTTVAYALNDSPVGQLAWIAEKFEEWCDLGDGPRSADGTIAIDDLLTNVSIYWFTGTGATAAQFIYAAHHAELDWTPAPTPSGIAVFDAEPLVRKLLDPQHMRAHWSEFDHGGHFPMLQVPGLLVDDLRSFFRRFR